MYSLFKMQVEKYLSRVVRWYTPGGRSNTFSISQCMTTRNNNVNYYCEIASVAAWLD